MRRREPPPLAMWMLEHLMPADCDEALAGDLLEVFRTGRSDAWFWRQAVAAFFVSWTYMLRGHLPLIAFALLWSMLAPAWKVFSDHARENLMNNWLWRGPGALPIFGEVGLWLALNAAFLWSAILLYSLSHRSFGRPIAKKKQWRAFLLAPMIFLPSLAAAEILMLLYSYPGLTNARLAATPLGRIVDVGIPADVLRIPYCISVIAALWGAIPRIARRSEAEPDDFATHSIQSGSLAFASPLDSFSAGQFFALMLAAGLVNAMIAGFVLCRLPDPRAMDVGALFARAVSFVLIGALAGMGGSWFYWNGPANPFRHSAPLPFWRFGLVCASGWVWVPSMLAFGEQLSPAGAFAAMIGSYALATGLRHATGAVFVPAAPAPARTDLDDGELFAESLQKPPFEVHGYLISFCLYAAGLALTHGWNYTGAVLLASAAFTFAWRRTVPKADHDAHRDVVRLAVASVLAVLVTMWALLDGYAHRNQASAAEAINGNTPIQQSWRQTKPQHLSTGVGGFESIILWPLPEKKQVIPPPPPQDSLLAPGTKRPIVIRFTGPYWFTQPPDKRPGPLAHQAHGTPARVDILSSNRMPLVMNAHQFLSSSLRVALCREIDVQIENRDNLAGEVSLGLFLEDNSTPGKPSVYLGQQPIMSTLPAEFVQKSAPEYEVLRFMIPESAKIHRFDEISILFLPDIEHRYIAPKIAIEQFQLSPR